MDWLADRFFNLNGAWIDAASGAAVRVLIEDARAGNALDFDEQCARLAGLRHPCVNPLLDYGAASNAFRFEAYACLPPIAGVAGSGALLAHAARFLRAAGVTLDGGRVHLAMRQVSPGRGRPPRALGITLQPRRALAAVQEVLECPSAASTVATLVGPHSAGLRTTRSFIARSARMLGFVPVSPAVLVKHLAESADSGRHFCILDDEESAGVAGLAGALVRLAAASTRRHVVIRFRRQRKGRQAIVLDGLSVRSMIGMVFVDERSGPTERELFDAARAADGRPGAFVAQLTGGVDEIASSGLVVHETAQQYGIASPRQDPAEANQPRRTLQAALRASTRAEALALRGRHASAERLLRRASRVLSGRGRTEEAAECLVRAGSLACHRGRTGDAAALFEQGRTLSGNGSAALRATIGLGSVWCDELRLVEAEAVLRGALAAADGASDSRAIVAATAGLVDCLNLQERASEAVAVAAARDGLDAEPSAAMLLCALSRAHCALGRTVVAVRLARRAESLARTETDTAGRLAVNLALAEALGTAGDTAAMTGELERTADAARRAHLPMIAVTARLLECEHGCAFEPYPGGDHRVRQLRALERLALPRRYRARLSAVLASLHHGRSSEAGASIHETGRARTQWEAAAALESFLEACHQAPDDSGALTSVCAEAMQRLRAASVNIVAAADHRVLASAGRAWGPSSTVIERTLATGQAGASDDGIEPRESAEAVRHGGQVIAAMACRWSAGTAIECTLASAVLRAAALAAASPARAVLDLAVPPPPAGPWADLLGTSPAASTLRDAVTRAARAPFSVLIEGESGCGKELVARAIHRLSPRRERRMCAVNCAALTDELVEAELFGHARGAFTGAAVERAGLFEEADGGTLFLDEVTELSARAQAKLLRVLQEGEVRRVGENFCRRVDARIVAATNRQLGEEVQRGRFRADLRFRLDVIRIAVPPLRDRPGDVPILAAHFWNDAAQRVGSRASLTNDAIMALARYDWPGNVRELQNVIAWIAVHSPGRGRIGPAALPDHVAQSSGTGTRSFAAARAEFERRFVRAAIAGADGQVARAAKALGISRQGLSKMMQRLHIDPKVRCNF
jgi:DNA-binding NtrC family response regulator